MAKVFLGVVLFCAYFSSISSIPIVQDEEGNVFYLVPATAIYYKAENVPLGLAEVEEQESGRQKRETVPWKETQDHKWTGGASASGPEPLNVGGSLGYQHVPSGNSLNLGVSNTHSHGMNLGTGVGADGCLNLYRNDNHRVDAVGSYSRSYGGAFGTSKPNYYGGLEYSYRFRG